MTESFPFHSWMPKPAGVAVLLALFVPLFFSGGTYLSNINEMAGSMGVQTEEFQFLSLCASIGMSMVFPFMVPYLRGRNVKAVYIGGYAVLALLNVVCAVSRNLPLLALCSFLIGFVRVALVLNTTFVIAPYMLGINTLDMFLHDPPTASEAYRGEHARTVLMPVLYCYILCIVQFSNFVSAWMAYEFSWEYTYWLVVGMMLAAILLVMLTFCKAPSQGCRLSSSRLPDAVLLVVAMGALCYMLVFGKTLDWFDSRSMRVALAVAAVGGRARAGGQAGHPRGNERHNGLYGMYMRRRRPALHAAALPSGRAHIGVCAAMPLRMKVKIVVENKTNRHGQEKDWQRCRHGMERAE